MKKLHSLLNTLVTFAAWVASTTVAQAHMVLEYQVANAASSYKASFKVGHACRESPIKQIVVNIPARVSGAKPVPKPGWTLAKRCRT